MWYTPAKNHHHIGEEKMDNYLKLTKPIEVILRTFTIISNWHMESGSGIEHAVQSTIAENNRQGWNL